MNTPVVIETRHRDWIRRDMGGICFNSPRTAYDFLVSHAPDGRLSDCVEITALLSDWSVAGPIREVRRPLYGASRWAATTTLPVAKDLPEGLPFTMEGVAYGGGASYAINPAWMYDLSHMVLSLIVVQPVGEGDLIHLSGVVSWDSHGNVLHPGDVDAQVRQILDYAARMLRESGSSLSDLVRVRTFTSRPQVGQILQDRLAERIQRAFVSHQMLSSLDPTDLGQLVCEVQFTAARGATRASSAHGTSVVLGGATHLYLAPVKREGTSEAVSIEQEAEEVVHRLKATCEDCGLNMSNLVSLLVEVADKAAGAVLSLALHRVSGGAFRAGITASVNHKIVEDTGRRILLTGTAIGV
ncbi:MAG: RidA family protein [Candidatus Latescibacteria bacterium]|nr:RidA family protein [Candidatus Latescibacterota bacterium]